MSNHSSRPRDLSVLARSRRGWPFRVALLSALAASLPALAQDPVAEKRPITQGVDRPIHDYSGEGDASSIELNPAMISAGSRFDLVVRGYRTQSDFARGNGTGVFLSASLPLGVAFGVGVQGIWPALGHDKFDEDIDLNPSLAKFSYAMSVGDARAGAIGVAIHGSRLRGGWLRAPDLDFGTVLRLTDFASLGAMARLGPVSQLGPAAETILVGELAVRPLRTRALELAGGVKAYVPPRELDGQDRSGVVLPRGRIALRHQGIAVAGEVEQVTGVELDEQSLAVLRDVKALRGSVALQLAWDFVTAEAGVHLGLSPGVDGYGGAVRFSSDRQGRVFWRRPVDAQLVSIDKIQGERGLIRALSVLERAREAGRRTVIVLDARSTGLGWASLEELRAAVVRVRNAGGHVFAYLESAGLKDYYVASAAERVFIHPAGQLSIPGLASTRLYYRDALEKIGVRVEALHIDEFKSAHESFTRADRSEPDRIQRQALLDATFGHVVRDIAQARGLTLADVKTAINESPLTPEAAVEIGLADKVVHRDQVTQRVSEAIGATVEFAEFPPPGHARPTWGDDRYIAAVLVEGTIVDGESITIPFFGLQMAGADTIIETLRKLREDPACEGIVLRVNSPGGSALASDLIWREVDRTRTAHKKAPRFSPPIVVSMGDVAASGGYYISMGSEKVFAHDTTVTGSIGVVSQHFDASGLLGILGIRVDTLKRGNNPGMFEPYRPFTEDQKRRLEASMEHTYDLFRKRVSKARGLPMERVHELGRGRVYAGSDARPLGLVDGRGGLFEAVAYLREQAGLRAWQKTRVRVFPAQESILDMILDSVDAPFLLRGVGDASKARAAIPKALNPALARLPLSILFLPQAQPSVILDREIRIE